MATRRQRLARIGLGDQWTDQIAAQNAQNIAIQQALQAANAQDVFQTPPKTVTLRLVDTATSAPLPAASTGMSTGTKVVLVVGGAAAVGGIAWLLLK